MKKSRIRIRGTDRFFMMLSRDIRRRWLQYADNRKIDLSKCVSCGSTKDVEADHIEAVGARPRKPEDFCSYIYAMVYGKCQALCRVCNRKKRDK